MGFDAFNANGFGRLVKDATPILTDRARGMNCTVAVSPRSAGDKSMYIQATEWLGPKTDPEEYVGRFRKGQSVYFSGELLAETVERNGKTYQNLNLSGRVQTVGKPQSGEGDNSSSDSRPAASARRTSRPAQTVRETAPGEPDELPY